MQLIQLLQILYAKDVDQRSTTFEKSMSVGKDYQRRTRMLILRAAMLKQHIHVKVRLFLQLYFLIVSISTINFIKKNLVYHFI